VAPALLVTIAVFDLSIRAIMLLEVAAVSKEESSTETT
jgi:hypothetical protein